MKHDIIRNTFFIHPRCTRLADTLDDRSGIVVESDQNMDGYFIQRYIIHKCDIIIHDTRLADTLDGRSGIVAASWDRAAVPCIHVVVVVDVFILSDPSMIIVYPCNY